MPSASRREVFESQTTIAGAGWPSGRRAKSRLRQSSVSAWPARPNRTVNWSSRPEATPTNAFSEPLEDPRQGHPRGVVEVGRAVGDDPGAEQEQRRAPPGGSPSWRAPRRAARRRRSPPRRPRRTPRGRLARPRRPPGRTGPTTRARRARWAGSEVEPDLVPEVRRPEPRRAAPRPPGRRPPCTGRSPRRGPGRRCNRCGCPAARPARGARPGPSGRPPKVSVNDRDRLSVFDGCCGHRGLWPGP